MGAIGAQQNDLVTRGKRADLGIITASLSFSETSSQEVGRLIVDALQAFEADSAIAAIVLLSLSVPTQNDNYEKSDDVDFSEVIGQIEGMTKPVIAALDGPVFDGAFELALACDLRVATPSSVVGFPSLMIGVPPHNGATQRLPRLIGIAQSLDLLSAEKGMPADKTAAGLIDRIGDEIIEMARGVATSAQKMRLSVRSVAPGDAEIERRSLSTFLKRAKGIAAAEATAELITGSPGYSYEDGLRRELSNHNRFRNSPETAALRHLQRAETLAKSVPGLNGVKPRTIGKAAVVGAGTMGSGIAYSLAASGLHVIVLEQTAETATVGRERIAGLLQAQHKSGRLSDRGLAEMSDRLQVTDLWDAAADVDLVIEAAFEDLDVKADIFAKLDRLLKHGTILATNTSYLDVDIIAEKSGRPSDMVGLHFFSPAHIMRLLEVVQAQKTDPQVLATALTLATRIGKLPIVARVCDGFIGNRIFAVYRRHAEYLLEDGASPYEIDAALQAFGFAMGPFAVSDMSGLDIAWAMRKRRAATRNPLERYVGIPDILCEAGRLGRKAGAGWYDYVDGKPVPSDAVQAIVTRERARQGVSVHAVASEAIQLRILAVMANEGAKVLEEGISARASDIDLVFVNGYGFPRLKGGPMFAADQIGLSRILDEVKLAARVGGANSEPSDLLVRLTREGRTFAEWQREKTNNT